jgi:hypothetical protein
LKIGTILALNANASHSGIVAKKRMIVFLIIIVFLINLLQYSKSLRLPQRQCETSSVNSCAYAVRQCEVKCKNVNVTCAKVRNQVQKLEFEKFFEILYNRFLKREANERIRSCIFLR